MPRNSFQAAGLDVDASGKYISPSFIDTHIYIEYTKLVPGELARLSVPRDTTTDLADENCIANVLGGKDMDFMGITSTPLRILGQVSHNVPMSPEIELGGASVSTSETCERVSRSDAAAGRIRSFLLRPSLYREVVCCTLCKEAHNRSYGTSGRQTLMGVYSDLDSAGHIDHHVREAVRLGVPVLQAYRRTTLNPAAYYRLDHALGNVTPEKLADLLIPGNLEDARPEIAVIDRIVGRGKESLFVNTNPIPGFGVDTIHINPYFFDPSAFIIFPRAGQASAWVQAMEMYDGYFKRAFHARLVASLNKPGELLVDTRRNVFKVVVIDRHHRTRNRGIGFVRGFGLKRGAIGCTTNCENQKLVVVGTSDAEIANTVKAISVLGGSFVAVCAESCWVPSNLMSQGACRQHPGRQYTTAP